MTEYAQMCSSLSGAVASELQRGEAKHMSDFLGGPLVVCEGKTPYELVATLTIQVFRNTSDGFINQPQDTWPV